MEQTSTSTQSSKSPDQAGVPFRNTSHNYTTVQKTSSQTTQPMNIKMPDGRRNSFGEKIPSPVERWKPDFARRQSWNREDLKREHVLGELGKVVEKKGDGWGTGFTEVEGT